MFCCAKTGNLKQKTSIHNDKRQKCVLFVTLDTCDACDRTHVSKCICKVGAAESTNEKYHLDRVFTVVHLICAQIDTHKRIAIKDPKLSINYRKFPKSKTSERKNARSKEKKRSEMGLLPVD